MGVIDGWELYDATERRQVAVGSLSDCMLARLDYVSATLSAGLAPTVVEVRPRVVRGSASR